MKKTIGICWLALTLVAATSASAGEITCAGAIEQVNFHAPDTMLLKLSGMNTAVFFCKPNAQWTVPGTTYTTSAEMCRTLVAMFMAGKMAEKTVAVMYFDGNDVPTSCSSWPAWGSANIRYFAWAD